MEHLSKWIAVLGRMSAVYLDKELSHLDINGSHHAYIMHICNTPGIMQDSLRELMYVNPSNITRALQYLEDNGFIEKVVLESDKRTCQLFPTEKARAIYPEILAILAKWESQITQDMTDDEKEQLFALMHKAGVRAARFFY